MTNIKQFEANVNKYDSWYDRYPDIYESEVLAIKDHFERLPDSPQGIEIALGTGRFCVPLGIREGVEPAGAMREFAMQRGIEVMEATAEHLPYKDMRFDFALFVTICHLDNVEKAFREAHRVLSNNGVLIIGFIDKNGEIGKEYQRTKAESTFFSQARFYGVNDVLELLKECRFRDPVINQTLFGALDDIDNVQAPIKGHGEGSFVVISAVKK